MNKTYLYRLYSSDDELLYVGITKDLFARLSAHRDWQPWWPDVDYYSVKEFKTREEAEALEASLIATAQPEHNKISGVRSDSIATTSEPKTRARRNIPLPPEEALYLSSLNGDEAYTRAAELRQAGWALTQINAVMRVTPDRYSLRTQIRYRANAATGVPVPIPPLSDEQERQLRAVPRTHLTAEERDQIKEYARYSAKLRPEYTDEHPVVVKVNEYRVLVVRLYNQGVRLQDIAEAAGRHRSSIQKIYTDGLALTGEKPRIKRRKN